ncbi:tRNA pseudouridine(38-40) synthase TruA [Ruminococcus sp. CLA-AA-H200]|uniref:tRNA pseudouridine synthase A n=1 Tax=Ruminococcus turbiniformis TaxID=2881258 RepID=A0ABS8FSG6_9FIRM|nr:tRNA pseudouridine(38-40) synthase TruA [Ruminococcus turbiniformis]MCC2252940.1 tRNA pseudouridine(38-40) synthase TruA [Ruminococcus turbiniformis]
MKRIRLTVAYDGSDYCGWQIQPNGITVESVLNDALSRITGEEIRVTGASRTDAGVHARGNIAVFDSNTTIPPERISYAVNTVLPDDVVVIKSEQVPADWHPRYCDSVKTYEYCILNREMPDPLRRRGTWHVSFALDVEKMRDAAAYLTGEHDFRSFCSIHTGAKSTVRTVYSIEIEQSADIITIRIQGNGFLYNMVRIIAGTLVSVGRGLRTPQDVGDMLEARDREKAEATAPPQGLILDSIRYTG